MTTFFILRHGETTWNKDRNRYCGKTNIPLSTTGMEQAKVAGKFLSKIRFDSIYSSPLIRAHETAKLVAQQFPYTSEIQVDDRLAEIDFGKWEGLTRDEIKEKYKQSWNEWNRDPSNTRAGETGETATMLYDRTLHFFEQTWKQAPDETILVVAHNTVNRMFITRTLGLPFSHYRKIVQTNTGISILEINERKEFQWRQINSVMHLL